MKAERLRLACSECGTLVLRLQCQIKGKGHVYCSRACLGASKRHGSELYCALCDKPFYRRFGEQDQDVRVHQFCSRDCYMQWRQIGSTSYLKIGPRHIHRVVVEEFIGRPLTSIEVVHHVDLDRQNNALTNLMLFPDSRTHMLCHWGKLSDAELRSFSLV